MKSMKLSEMDKKEMAQPKSVLDRESYPYGLCLHIDDEMYKRLEIKKVPGIGQEFMILAKASVKEVRKEMNGQPDEIYMTLQITDMDIKESKEEKSAESMLYGED